MPEISPLVLAMVADKLDRLGFNYAFVGGSIVGFLLDDAQLSPVRPTDDLDIILEVLTTQRYSDIEEKLRGVGFAHDTRQGAPMCRWILHGLTIDIMPTEGGFMGLNTHWFAAALASAALIKIDRFSLKIISPVAFIATKLAAFADRGKGDFFASHDIEDLMAVIDGRAAIVEEIATAPAALRDYVVASLHRINQSREFQEALPGYLSSDAASQRRLPLLRKKLQAIAEMSELT
jgi:predicted nucleotidyltransferase